MAITDILANILTEVAFGAIKLFKPHKSLDGNAFTKEQIAAVTKCIVTLAVLAVAAVLIINLDVKKLGMTFVFAIFYTLIYQAFKD